MDLHEVVTMKQTLTACIWFSSFLLKALVSRVKRRFDELWPRLRSGRHDELPRARGEHHGSLIYQSG